MLSARLLAAAVVALLNSSHGMIPAKAKTAYGYLPVLTRNSIPKTTVIIKRYASGSSATQKMPSAICR